MQTDPLLKDRARRLRREMTGRETRLWRAPCNRRFVKVKFAPQVMVGAYIVDFAARSHRLIVEVDGDTHNDQSRGEKRTAWLEARGYRVLRCTSADVMMNLDGVLLHLGVALAAAPHPGPLPVGEREQRA
ncbi:endonuclease domain-containing protein [Sphingomonas sp. DT-51]|uniref:endonuclease domain-containing protein n=1 Tax=Sphingomonas sp. DT-51 TaxID=3396165 RepID=UPI003F1D4831